MGESVIGMNVLKRYVRGIVQVGVGEIGEEHIWKSAGIQHQVYVEPFSSHFYELLERTPESEYVRCFNVALSNYNGVSLFHLTNQCDSHSLHNVSDKSRDVWLKTDKTIPVVVKTLDTLVEENAIDLKDFNLLYMDTQGCEYQIIEGAVRSLEFFDIVVAEIFFEDAYDGAVQFDKWEPFMAERGFRLKWRFDFVNGVFTDAVFVRLGSSIDLFLGTNE